MRDAESRSTSRQISCRSCAVHGGTYILGRPIKSIVSVSTDEARPNFIIEIEGISQGFAASTVVLSQYHPQLSIQGMLNVDSSLPYSTSGSSRSLARCIAIVDGPVVFPTSNVPEVSNPANVIDTFAVVFPPGSLGEVGKLKNAVTAMVTGEGTFSCPKGQCK